MIIASMPVSLREYVRFSLPPRVGRELTLPSCNSHAGKHPKVAPADCFPGATIAP